jgi:hypothetical protein
MMTASGRKKRLFTLVGLLVLLVVGLLWHAGTLMHTSRKEVRKQIPRVAGASAPAAVVTKKLAAPAPAEALPAAGDALTVHKKLPLPAPVAEAPPAPAPPSAQSAPPGTSEGPAAAAAEEAPAAAAVPVAAAGPAHPSAEPPLPTPASAPAPSAPLPPPATAAKANVERGALPFSILLSSCREKENALAALGSFQRTGSAPYIVRSEVKGRGAWWRVLTGAYTTVDEAARAQKALGVPGAVVVRTPFANRLGVFSSEAAAADAAARLHALGFFPYSIRVLDGSVELVAGAFIASAEAESLQRELQAQGIAAEVIRR